MFDCLIVKVSLRKHQHLSSNLEKLCKLAKAPCNLCALLVQLVQWCRSGSTDLYTCGARLQTADKQSFQSAHWVQDRWVATCPHQTHLVFSMSRVTYSSLRSNLLTGMHYHCDNTQRQGKAFPTKACKCGTWQSRQQWTITPGKPLPNLPGLQEIWQHTPKGSACFTCS